jgi:perosamine synthetase
MTALRTIPFGRPWITDREREAVVDVLHGHILTHGPQCKSFEDEFAAFMGDGANCVSVSSCMAALHLAYFFMRLGPGDEVIVPAQTHTATAHAVELVGARPIFVDCELETGNIDASKIEALITPRTKAISLVHFLGIPCQMDEIIAIADRHDLKVVEDCALAVGARYKGKHVGLFGDVGCFSFYPVKHITTSEGGMFVSRHEEVAHSVARLRAFGTDRSYAERNVPGLYDVIVLGLNYRMGEMQAALGREQLKRIDEILERRKANFNGLKSRLSGLGDISILDTSDPEATNSYYCLNVILHEGLRQHRKEIITKLNESGVGTSIYYPQPVPRLSYYRNKYGYQEDAYPNATVISDYSIALPVGPHVSESDVDYIAENLRRIIKEVQS